MLAFELEPFLGKRITARVKGYGDGVRGQLGFDRRKYKIELESGLKNIFIDPAHIVQIELIA